MSKCSCIRGANWNFNIECVDVKTLKYTDFSDWNLTEPYSLPETHTITITTPDNKKVEIEVKPNDSTIIKHSGLGFSSCILDGIYCLEAYSCKSCNDGTWGDRKFTKQEAIMPQSKCKIDNLVATGNEAASKMSSQLKQIESVSKIGQSQKAADLYRIFDKELSKLNCSSCC